MSSTGRKLLNLFNPFHEGSDSEGSPKFQWITKTLGMAALPLGVGGILYVGAVTLGASNPFEWFIYPAVFAVPILVILAGGMVGALWSLATEGAPLVRLAAGAVLGLLAILALVLLFSDGGFSGSPACRFDPDLCH